MYPLPTRILSDDEKIFQYSLKWFSILKNENSIYIQTIYINLVLFFHLLQKKLKGQHINSVDGNTKSKLTNDFHL